ncbi:DUF222 domain-containing protein [Mycobacterium leprae]|uniref:DUF222 domain-containing protein n=1 Tax=Mycobacterium leprae TaxID=1769 RepID=UPI001E2942BE|nr:DUF222 domain-containing protein [Mycobacterium leprae]
MPDATPSYTLAHAEQFLAQQAAKSRPNQVEKLAHRYALLINPDRKFPAPTAR